MYWFSTQKDVINWKKTLGNTGAIMTQSANLRALNSLPAGHVKVTAHTHSGSGPTAQTWSPT